MHKRLEKYLNQLRSQLRDLPAEQREIEVREIRQHLESLVADYMRAGASEEKAVTQSLDQFGSSRTNGRQLGRTWNRKRRPLESALMIVWAMLTALLAVSAFSVIPSTSVVSPSASDYTAIDREHMTEIQIVQYRWRMDNLALQRMDPREEAKVSKARGEAMERFQHDMNATNMRWQTNIQAAQRGMFIQDIGIVFGGSIALAVFFFSLARMLRSRRLKGMLVG